MGRTPKPKAIDGWSLPSAYHVIGGLGLAALLAVTPGWHEVTLHSHWTLSFTSAGARGGRLAARPAFLDAKEPLPSSYDFGVEGPLYEWWEASGKFKPKEEHELLKPTLANLFGLEIRFKAQDEQL